MPKVAQRLEAEWHPLLDELLMSGGDARLSLDPASGLNVYGCAPRPRGDIDDFSSSTASSISERAYHRVKDSWRRFSARAASPAIDAVFEEARTELKTYLGLSENQVEIVFSPSGTDAQLLVLFLVRAILGTPLVTVIVGADQTGSGIAYTAKGLHFTDRDTIRKGDDVEGLAKGVRSITVPLCDSEGKPRTLANLDGIVTDAVEAAIADGAHVLLQAMASSKLGWAAPSHACIRALAERWPDKVRVVMDACQMRVGNARIRDYLACGHIVLATGSKFFCGPPFSGALLIPATLRGAVAAICDVAPGLKAYSSKFDWPSCWPKLRMAFPAAPNIGQWLRWEAALEEMHAYHAVPAAFRATTLRRFAEVVPSLIVSSPWLAPFDGMTSEPDPVLDGEFTVPTIFSFMPRHPDGWFTRAQCAILHRVLNQDISASVPANNDVRERRLAARHCHIGQPVAVGPADCAVLRISSSARLVTRCWSTDRTVAAVHLEAEIRKIEAVIEKLFLVARQFAAVAT